MSDQSTDLAERIKRQVEFYFSDSNFRRDKFLRTKAESDPQGFVDISVLLTFNRLKQLTEEPEKIASALADSDLVQLSADHTKIRRTNPLPLEDDTSKRTVYVKSPFTRDTELDDLIKFFKQYGDVQRVHMRKTVGRSKVFKGSVFVEFGNKEDAEKLNKIGNSEEGLQYKDNKCERVMMQDEYTELKLKEREERKKSSGANKFEFKREKTPNAILKLTGVADGIDFRSLQDVISKAAHVKFTEIDDSRVAHLRFASAEDCQKAKDAIEAARTTEKSEESTEDKPNLTFTAADLGGKVPETEILSGEEEDTYWEKVWNKQEERVKARSQKRGGGGFRGRNAKRARSS